MDPNEPRRDAGLNGRRILVFEDEYFLADDIAEVLRRSGAILVGPAGTLQDALDLLDSGQPIDSAVLDINLRGEMSYAVADRLLAAGIPFVFGTGYGVEVIPPRYRHLPRWEKPFDPSALARALAEFSPQRPCGEPEDLP